MHFYYSKELAQQKAPRYKRDAFCKYGANKEDSLLTLFRGFIPLFGDLAGRLRSRFYRRRRFARFFHSVFLSGGLTTALALNTGNHQFTRFERDRFMLRNMNLLASSRIARVTGDAFLNLENAKVAQFDPSIPNKDVDNGFQG